MPGMLRWLRLVALAIVTVVSLGLLGPGRGLVSLSRPLAVAALECSSSAAGALASESSHHWRQGEPRAAIENDAVEADLDDDDGDTRSHVSGDAAMALRASGSPRESGRALRTDAEIDTSRFASGTGLPRGPPSRA